MEALWLEIAGSIQGSTLNTEANVASHSEVSARGTQGALHTRVGWRWPIPIADAGNPCGGHRLT